MRRGALLALAALLVGACGQKDALSSTAERSLVEARKAGASAQVDALKDGRVTQAEVDSALDAFEGCLQPDGLAVLHPVIDPIYGPPAYDYQAGRPAGFTTQADLKVVNACDVKTFRFVYIAAQAEQRSRMNEAVRTRTQACVRDKKIPVRSGDTSIEAIVDHAGHGHGLDVVKCAGDAVAAIFPGVIATFHGDLGIPTGLSTLPTSG